MNKRKKATVLFLPLLILICFFALKFWAQEGCVEYVGGVFTENFNTEDYKDVEHTSVAYWPPGPITLNWLGGNLEITAPTGMGSQIYVCDAGDFDGDGYPDLIGLDITEDPVTEERRYVLILVRNTFEDLDSDGLDDDGLIFKTDESEIYETGLDVGPASITTADYNNDGLIDFFFYKNDSDDAIYDKFVAAMYINAGTATDPDFYPHGSSPNLDFTSRFETEGIYCRWSADHLCSTDIDKDGDVDVLVISQNQIFLVRNPGAGSFDIANFDIVELNYDQPPGYTIDMGGSTIEAADWDNDEDIDVIVGSVEDYAFLVFYKNDGTGYFTRHELPIPDPNCIGAVATCVGDFNQDGWLDLMCSNDVWHAGNDARMWMYRSKGPAEGEGIPVIFEFECLNDCLPITPPVYRDYDDDGVDEKYHDVDMGISVDFDMDGDIDWVFADANHSGDYYLARNELANVYTTYGEAWSTNISGALDPELYAITKVQITRLNQKTRGTSSAGLKVEYYLSNNNGKDWEYFTTFEGSDIQNYTNLPVHTFKHFGTHLRWKAILSAPEDPMEEYSGASFDTPLISQITFEYTLVDKKEYSRTSVVVTNVDDEGQKKKYLLASTFYFPTWNGHLRAYDLTAMTPETTAYSVLRTVSRQDLTQPSGREIVPSGVEVVWDAGELLNARSAATRTIYTTIPEDSILTRIDFNVTNVAILGPILQDVNNDNEGLIDFIRGEGREWKLGDSNHSNPVVVGPPDEAPTIMGEGYAEFMNTWADRRKVVYVGSNDGMIHCFDVLTGEELWGFIPYNLLPKIKNMWAVAEVTGERYFARDIYVDGSPMVADVYIDVNGDASKEWTTILICGQGAGKGSGIGGGTNYYFALDITDPDSPEPLWEFTHDFLGETWSVPVAGKIRRNGEDAWLAFLGSGYDNSPTEVVGNVFYAVDAETGEYFWAFYASEVDTTGALGWNIPNTIPGSPAILDIDQNGYADRVYVPDLDGRVWKVDVSTDYLDPTSWAAVTIYEDSNNYPIISKPAVWVDYVSGGSIPRLYFGTGGDDRAPGDASYSFIALKDSPTPEVEWYLGDSSILGLPAEKDMGNISIGERVWADPKVADYVVYFSTLTGSIDSVDPCESITGVGKLYARYIQAQAGTTLGGTAFETAAGPQESLNLAIKTRAAVTIGERERAPGGARKREVYIQEYDSTIQKLEQLGTSMLKVKSWREVYRVIR
ncbi:MAG: PQQ-binding-like beta-propeller repeat protein [Candidatus Aminicenantes bacterium]|nr:PQQ-binding-like beta-propeller repeat protein [Candidatus Aminicenantes bacterium]